jgi:hypothetical protein
MFFGPPGALASFAWKARGRWSFASGRRMGANGQHTGRRTDQSLRRQLHEAIYPLLPTTVATPSGALIRLTQLVRY